MTEAEKNFIQSLVGIYAGTGLRDLPFRDIIEACSGYQVKEFDENSPDGQFLVPILSRALQTAVEEMNVGGIGFHRRVNEKGNDAEGYLKRALAECCPDMSIKRPTAPSGHTRSAGYPDILCEVQGISFYLECKIYEEGSEDSKLRSFYLQPARRGEFKVDRDAYHLLAAFRFRTDETGTRAVGWRLLSLHDLKVRLKPEFNASNHDMYTTDLTVTRS